MSLNIVILIIAVLFGFAAVSFMLRLIQERDRFKDAEILRLRKENQECREHVDILVGEAIDREREAAKNERLFGREEGYELKALRDAELRKQIRDLEEAESKPEPPRDEPPQADWVDDGLGDEG